MYKLCHTEESSQRQRTLEHGLLDALASQPYEKITLTELCRRLGVPRKTFYRYFPTKEDCLLALIDHTLSDCNTKTLSGWGGGQELQLSHLQCFFHYWLQQRPFLDAVRDNGLCYLLLDRTTVIVDRMKEQESADSFAKDQVAYFIAHGLMTTVMRWHFHGFPCPPEEMAEVFAHSLRNSDLPVTRLMF